MKNRFNHKLKAKWPLMVAMLMLPAISHAQQPSFLERATAQDLLLLFALGLMLFVTLAVLTVAIYTLYILKFIMAKQRLEKGIVEVAPVAKLSWWQKFDRSVTDAVPLEKEDTILLDHNYDGIRELDNHLPPWWKWLFYATIVWSVVYLFVYHVSDSLPLQEEEYQNELAEAKAVATAKMASSSETMIDESNVEFSDEAAIIANGKTIYQRNCAVCHQNDGGGLVGPNLTDNYWLHGGSMADIFKVVKYGVPQKGMIAWQSQLSPTDMRDVSSFILTLGGTTPAVPKEPQGELYVPATTEEVPATEAQEPKVENGTAQQ